MEARCHRVCRGPQELPLSHDQCPSKHPAHVSAGHLQLFSRGGILCSAEATSTAQCWLSPLHLRGEAKMMSLQICQNYHCSPRL